MEFAAPYQVTGSFEHPILAIKPLKFINTNTISEIFGNTLPIIDENFNNNFVYEHQSLNKVTDPFTNQAFDNVVSNKIKNDEKISEQMQSVSENKFGVKINRRKTVR